MSRTTTEIGPLLQMVCAQDTEGWSDGRLLSHFLAHRDEAAFAALVRRHGPMVLGVCRRILANAADAEDAFQATFIVLVRRAAALTTRGFVGDWLHGVARHAALDARRAAARRRNREMTAARPEAQTEAPRNDWLALLDDEINRLPAKYRLPIVLCELEGKTRQEAAAQLGWPEGTVAGRLARGRELLARRLLRGGLAVGAGATGWLAEGAAQAALPPGLAQATAQAARLMLAGAAGAQGTLSAGALNLARGVTRTMFWKKAKTVMLVLTLGVLLAGAGGLTLHLLAGESAPAAQREPPPQAAAAALRAPQGDKKPQPTANKRVQVLDEIMEIRDFQSVPMTLKEFVLLISEKLMAEGHDVAILLNSAAFREESPKESDIWDTQLIFPLGPRKLTVTEILRFGLAQVPSRNATFVLYPRHIEITTVKRASAGYKLQQPVLATFAGRKLGDVLRELSETTATSIVVDVRVGDKEDRLVSATFLNDVTLAGALRALTEMADLKMVVLRGGVIYVTTPAHAEALRKDKAVVDE
jgi:RNA polymerase sigma factor (sigma-70 family)